MRFADTVAVVDHGVVVAYGSVNEIAGRTDLPLLEAQPDFATAFDAVVIARHAERGLLELAVGEQRLLAPAIDVAPGVLLRVRVCARDVVLATQNPSGLSIYNRLAGRVARIIALADNSTVAVHVSVGEIEIVAHVTRNAVQQLALSVGAVVFVLIKSVAVETMERAVSLAKVE